ncbi:hypothetical protein EPN42_04730 [bacterium]|nr:MAG: hypothetical protein EPN42_04730 [bacterium]
MPIYRVTSVTEQGIPQTGERYARDLRELADRERAARRQLVDWGTVRTRRVHDGAYAHEKQLFFHRFAQAMRHRGYDRATTAQYLMEVFPERDKRSHQLMRSVLSTLAETELPLAMSQHPQLFTIEEVEAVAASRNVRETLSMLARTAYDRRSLTRELAAIITVPAIVGTSLVFIGAFVLFYLVPMLESNVFPYTQNVPAFFQWLSAARAWLFRPLDLGLVVLVLAVLFAGGITLYQVPAVQVWLVGQLYRNSRGYGRVLHGFERRRIYTAWIQTLESEGIDALIGRGMQLANEAGRRAFKRAAARAPQGINPLTRLRAATPYLPAQEVGLLVEGFSEGGVKATREVLEELVAELNESIPFDIAQAKDEIRVALTVALTSIIITGLVLFSGAVFYTLFHLRAKG